MAVEFVLIAPVFLALLLGTMAFAIYFSAAVTVTHAAAEGARASIGGLGGPERQSLAQARAQQVLGSAPMLDHTKATISSAPSGQQFSLTVSYPLSALNLAWFFGFLDFATGGSSEAPGEAAQLTRTFTVTNGGY